MRVLCGKRLASTFWPLLPWWKGKGSREVWCERKDNQLHGLRIDEPRFTHLSMRLLGSNGTPSAVVGPCDFCCIPPSPSALADVPDEDADSRPTVSLPSASPSAIAVDDIVEDSTVAVVATNCLLARGNQQSRRSFSFHHWSLVGRIRDGVAMWRCRLWPKISFVRVRFVPHDGAPKRLTRSRRRLSDYEATNARIVTNLSAPLRPPIIP